MFEVLSECDICGWVIESLCFECVLMKDGVGVQAILDHWRGCIESNGMDWRVTNSKKSRHSWYEWLIGNTSIYRICASQVGSD